MAMNLKANPVLQGHTLKQQRLSFDVGIVHHATPASKKLSSDMPGAAILRCEGLTAAADAVETITWTTAVDNSTGSSVFGILLNLAGNLADKVYRVTVVSHAGKTLAVTGPNNTADTYLTAGGNIAIEVAATALNLASTDDTLHVTVDYREVKP